MILPEVQVLLERARSARLSLDGLLDVLPEEYWSRAAAGSRWDVRDQLAHVASADDLLQDLLRTVAAGRATVWVGATQDVTELLSRREAPLQEFAGLSLEALREVAADARGGVESAFVTLDATMLEAGVHIAGAVDRWGEPLRWGLRAYLAKWAHHDSAHEGDIRAAIATTPDLSTVALTQRRRR
ncbi:MAG: hypothetical protein ABI782_13345 [Anaerolineaceae bacterium]